LVSYDYFFIYYFIFRFVYLIIIKNATFHFIEGESLEQRKDMLAQLDQLNAYQMILRGLTKNSQEWKKKMLNLALTLKENFWNEKYNVMWGNANYEVLDSVGDSYFNTSCSYD